MRHELVNISHSFGDRPVLENIQFGIEDDSITVILGPSGCGKTTLLNIVAGLVEPLCGSRKMFEGMKFSYAFQEPRLLPWLSARDNLLFALKGCLSEDEAGRRADHFLSAAGLSDAARLKPGSMSGGMRQRLSLARAFALPSAFLLLDEAFQSVDIATRLSLMEVFLALWKNENRTALIVTHDIAEAVYLADQVLVLGGTPSRIMDQFVIGQERSSRSFGSETATIIEKRLYASLLKTRTEN